MKMPGIDHYQFACSSEDGFKHRDPADIQLVKTKNVGAKKKVVKHLRPGLEATWPRYTAKNPHAKIYLVCLDDESFHDDEELLLQQQQRRETVKLLHYGYSR
jgi:hypothetical protein